MTIHVITPGLLTTVQDHGRRGRQHLGIPVSGAMDPWALRMANLLVGNEADAAGLECTVRGPTLRFDEPTLVAVTGGDFDVKLAGVAVPTWRAILVPADAELQIGNTGHNGCRAYIAVAGGIATPSVLGSRSTYLRARLGGHEGRALRSGDDLPTGEPGPLTIAIAEDLAHAGRVPAVSRWGAATELRPQYGPSAVARLIAAPSGPGLDACVDALCAQTFSIAAQSDRMGFRLRGEPLACSAPAEQLSEAVAFGTVQLPPGGSPIILMADRQTTGGYPRLGTVASVDLPLVAQLAPGDRIRFAPISLDAAQRLYLAREQDMAQARVAIRLRYHV